MDAEALIHFLGGAIGGTAGTALTCPLEVVKTRMQSLHGFQRHPPHKSDGNQVPPSPQKVENTSNGTKELGGVKKYNFTSAGTSTSSNYRKIINCLTLPSMKCRANRYSAFRSLLSSQPSTSHSNRLRLTDCFKDVYNEGGIRALYKGLVPNLIGVAPSKAVYFYFYSTGKRILNSIGTDYGWFVPDSAVVHMGAAGVAGFWTATFINPIWFVKTRMQLHHGHIGVTQCIRKIYKNEGIRGFWKGISASYMGISETIIQFVLYEYFRGLVDTPGIASGSGNFLNFMMAGGAAKFCACVAAYPHEVVRTRLREEGTSSKGFFRTFLILWREDQLRALYRGLLVQLLRSVPNTAITMGAYELVVYVLHTYYLRESSK